MLFCKKCHTYKDSELFAKRKGSKTGFRYECKLCYNKRLRLHYYKNHDKSKDRAIIRSKKYRINNKEKCKNSCKKWASLNKDKIKNIESKYKLKKVQFIDNFKKNKTCSRCTESRPECLQFHHINPLDKKYNISYLIMKKYSFNTLKLEIEKCILLCSNCHRKEHAKIIQHNNVIKKKYVFNIKNNSKCYFCPEDSIYCLDFHHIDPSTKVEIISNMYGMKKYTMQDLKNELKKCIIICSNCHFSLHKNKLFLPSNIDGIITD